MKADLLRQSLFRHSFIIALILGILCRAFVLRVTDKQYPTRPQDYLEQIITSALASALGAIALPALMDKEFSLNFFCYCYSAISRVSSTRKNNVRKY